MFFSLRACIGSWPSVMCWSSWLSYWHTDSISETAVYYQDVWDELCLLKKSFTPKMFSENISILNFRIARGLWYYPLESQYYYCINIVSLIQTLLHQRGSSCKPQTLMAMVQNLLYERRFGPYFVEPDIAGLDAKSGNPYICALDLIGCPCEPADFVVFGTCSESLYGR